MAKGRINNKKNKGGAAKHLTKKKSSSSENKIKDTGSLKKESTVLVDFVSSVLAPFVFPSDKVCKQVDWSGVIFNRSVTEIYNTLVHSHLRLGNSAKNLPAKRVVSYNTESAMVNNSASKGGTVKISLQARYENESKPRKIQFSVTNITRDINNIVTSWVPTRYEWPFPYFLTGPHDGGSRDTSVVNPKCRFAPVRSNDIMGKYNIDMSDQWQRYTGNLGNDLYDLVEGVERMVDGTRPLRTDPDNYHVQYVNHLQDMSVVVPCTPDRTTKQKVRIPTTENNSEFIHRAIKMQTSFWSVFSAEFFFIINVMAQNAEKLYPIELGFVHTKSTADGELRFHDSEIFKKDKSSESNMCRAVRELASLLQALIKGVTIKMTSLTRPGYMAHYFYSTFREMEEFLREGKYCLLLRPESRGIGEEEIGKVCWFCYCYSCLSVQSRSCAVHRCNIGKLSFALIGLFFFFIKLLLIFYSGLLTFHFTRIDPNYQTATARFCQSPFFDNLDMYVKNLEAKRKQAEIRFNIDKKKARRSGSTMDYYKNHAR